MTEHDFNSGAVLTVLASIRIGRHRPLFANGFTHHRRDGGEVYYYSLTLPGTRVHVSVSWNEELRHYREGHALVLYIDSVLDPLSSIGIDLISLADLDRLMSLLICNKFTTLLNSSSKSITASLLDTDLWREPHDSV